MAAHRQAGSAEGGRGQAIPGSDAYWATGVAAVDLELDGPDRSTGGGRRVANGGGEGQRLPEYRRVRRGANARGRIMIAEDVQPGHQAQAAVRGDRTRCSRVWVHGHDPAGKRSRGQRTDEDRAAMVDVHCAPVQTGQVAVGTYQTLRIGLGIDPNYAPRCIV